MANVMRPYLGRYTIVLYPLDDDIPYVFTNVKELTLWIYKEPHKKDYCNVGIKLLRIRRLKATNKQKKYCIIIESKKYEVNFVKAS